MWQDGKRKTYQNVGCQPLDWGRTCPEPVHPIYESVECVEADVRWVLRGKRVEYGMKSKWWEVIRQQRGFSRRNATRNRDIISKI
jgi:hypothetical protein